MLLELRVSNVLIIDQAVLRPEAGLCVISGETGAGKSLLMDALSLLRGDRAAAKLIGPAGEEAQVSAVIQCDPALLADLCQQHGLDCVEGQVILRRRVTRSGRSQAWVNDVPVSVSVLREVGDRLIDIRAQHEHLRLADPAYQRELLDRFGDHEELVRADRALRSRSRALAAELRQLDEGAADSLREREFVRFQLAEIDGLDPQPGELAELEERQHLLAGAEEWRGLAIEAGQALLEADGSVIETLGRLRRRLEDAPDQALREAALLLGQAGELADEAARACIDAGERIEVDEEARARCDERLGQVLDLIRKHGGKEEALHAARAALRRRLDELEGLDDRRSALQAERAAVERDCLRSVAEVKRRRGEAFERLVTEVHPELKALGMPRARLSLVEREGEGADVQEWHLQTNPGLAAGPLRAVVSGGEAARLALAVASVCAAFDPVPVLVFDEVDSGVGGRLGLAIAERLRHLSPRRSVLAITHSPQIAARADRHYRVSKHHAADSTAIRVEVIDGDERIGELADMLGGGAAARDQAIALLEVKTA